MKRRQFIVATGTAAAVGLAGCLGDGDNESPETVAEAYYEAAGDGDEDEAEGLLHPESQIEIDQDDEMIEFESIEADAEAVAEDIDASELAEFDSGMEGDPEIQPGNLSSDELDDIADGEEVTLVETDLEVEISEVEEGDPEEVEAFFEEEPVHVITATDGGEWFVLDDIHYSFTGP